MHLWWLISLGESVISIRFVNPVVAFCSYISCFSLHDEDLLHPPTAVVSDNPIPPPPTLSSRRHRSLREYLRLPVYAGLGKGDKHRVLSGHNARYGRLAADQDAVPSNQLILDCLKHLLPFRESPAMHSTL